jgi:hypothetical protein
MHGSVWPYEERVWKAGASFLSKGWLGGQNDGVAKEVLM